MGDYWSGALAWVALLLTVDTGGGASVEGDALTRDFAGRDSSDHRNYIDLHLGRKGHNEDEYEYYERSIEYRVRTLERSIYGEDRIGVIGMVKRQRLNTVLLVICVILNFVNLLLVWWLYSQGLL